MGVNILEDASHRIGLLQSNLSTDLGIGSVQAAERGGEERGDCPPGGVPEDQRDGSAQPMLATAHTLTSHHPYTR